jgi:hypothetical protein
VTDSQRLALAEIALDRRLTLDVVKLALGIDHEESDDLLRLLISSFDLGDKTRWNL